MKKFLYLLLAFTIILGVSCKKKEIKVPVSESKKIEKVSEQEFVLNLVKAADKQTLKPGDSIVAPINAKLVATSVSSAVLYPFKEFWNYKELLPVNKQIALTIVWVAPVSKSHLLVTDYNDLQSYNPSDQFMVLQPRPKYYVVVGKNKYWVTSNNKFWKTRK